MQHSATTRQDPYLRDDQRDDEGEFDTIVARYEGRERLADRVRLVGALHTALSALGMFAAGIVFVAIAPWGLISGDPTATWVLGGIGAVIAGIIGLVSLPGLICGIGLLRRRRWAKTLTIVVSALHLLNVPFGTALGAFSLYVVLQEGVDDLLTR